MYSLSHWKQELLRDHIAVQVFNLRALFDYFLALSNYLLTRRFTISEQDNSTRLTMAKVQSVLAAVLGLSSTVPASCPHPCIVINEDFPDPSFIRSSNGSFHAFATMASSHNFVQLATSPDFYHWEVLDVNPIPEGAGWETDQLWWAPHVSQRVRLSLILSLNDVEYSMSYVYLT